MASKSLLLLLGLLAIVLLISSEASARDLATSEHQSKEGDTSLDDAKYGNYPGGGYGGNPGYGGGGYPGGGGGGYPGGGGYGPGGGGYYGGGRGGYGCRYGCCYRGYNGCRRCCGYAGEKVQVESEPHN